MTDGHNQHDKETKLAILDNIEKYGCHLALLEADNYLPALVYTIELFKKFGHPELICFGLNTGVIASILNHACDLIKSDETLKPNKQLVCLEEIIKLDPSVNEIYHLQFGWRAWRDSKDEEWKYEQHPHDE